MGRGKHCTAEELKLKKKIAKNRIHPKGIAKIIKKRFQKFAFTALKRSKDCELGGLPR